MELDPWFLENLLCPVTHSRLVFEQGTLRSLEGGHVYPVVDGVPVMLVPDARQTMDMAGQSLARAGGRLIDARCPDLYLESLGVSEEEKAAVIDLASRQEGDVDPVVSVIVAATNGIMFREWVGKLKRYPIPELPSEVMGGGWFLDIGCNWGRWSIAAARRGFHCVGIDPSLGAVMAARRVARQMGFSSRYFVADGRFLPLRPQSFDVVYSYSVLQHMSKEDVRACLDQVSAVLRPGGRSVIQMPNGFGIRSLFHQARRGFRPARGFEVRYWSVSQLKRDFEKRIGPSRVSADCYFGLGIQESDYEFMTASKKIITKASAGMKRAAKMMPFLANAADSVFVVSEKGAI